MEIYVTTIYCRSGESYILGTNSTQAKAFRRIDCEMATVYGKNDYIDWEIDYPSGHWWYFYDGYTAEIQRTILDDDDMDY